MKTTKRLLAMLLVLAMTLSNLPVAALAEELAAPAAEETVVETTAEETAAVIPEESEETEETPAEEAPAEAPAEEPVEEPAEVIVEADSNAAVQSDASNLENLPLTTYYSTPELSWDSFLSTDMYEVDPSKETVIYFLLNEYNSGANGVTITETLFETSVDNYQDYFEIEEIGSGDFKITLTDKCYEDLASYPISLTVVNRGQQVSDTYTGDFQSGQRMVFTLAGSNDVTTITPIITDGAYISFDWLSNDGQGFYAVENEYACNNTDLGMMPGQEMNLIFYLNYYETEGAETMSMMPVHVQLGGEGSMSFDLISEEAAPDAENSGYYYRVTTDTWDQHLEIVTVLQDGTTIGGTRIHTNRFEMCAYTSTEMSNETCVPATYVTDVSEGAAFELYVGLDSDWTAESFVVDYGGQYITLEDTDNANVKRVVLTDEAWNALRDGWYVYVAVAGVYNGENRAFANFSIAPDYSTIPHDPFLSFGWLNDDGEGWYENGEHNGDMYRVMPGQEMMHIYYLNEWSADQGDYVARPVHVQSDGELTFELVGAENAAPGQENGGYFYRVTTGTWDQETSVYTTLEDGTKVYGVNVWTDLNDVCFYTSTTMSNETCVTRDYLVDMTEGAENELYVGFKPNGYWTDCNNFQVESWCSGWIWLEWCDVENMRRVRFTEDAMQMLAYGEYLWLGVGANVVHYDEQGAASEVNTFYANGGVVADPDTIPHDPYITICYLEDWGDGLFEGQDHYDGMGPLPGETLSCIFYLHVWDDAQKCYVDTPVHVSTGAGSIHLGGVKDNSIRGDQENSEYFCTMWVDNWDEEVEVYCELEDGTRVSFWGWTGRPELGFYTVPEMSNDTWCGHRPFETDPFGTNTIYFGLNSDWATVQDLWTEDWAADYVDIERINEYVYSITLTKAGMNQNMGQYLLGIPVCLNVVANDNPDYTEYRQTNIDFSRMELQNSAWLSIGHEHYELFLKDGQQLWNHSFPTGEFNEWGEIWANELVTALPQGLTYDYDANKLTMNNYRSGGEFSLGYGWYDENDGNFYQNLPTDKLTIELIGDNCMTSDRDIALNICDGLNVDFVGDGSLYIKSVNSVDNVDEGGYPYHYPAVYIDGTDVVFKENVNVTVEIAGEGLEACWDENGYMGSRPASLVAFNSPGENGADIFLQDNATLNTVVPDDARANGPTLDENDESVFWGHRNPGGYSSMQGFNSLNIYGNATLNTQGISLAWNPDNGDASYYIQTGGTVNIDSLGYYYCDEYYNEETGENEVWDGFYYVGLDTGPGCIVSISGGQLNIDVTANTDGENSEFEALSIMGGELNISGGQVNLNTNGAGKAMWIGGWVNDNTQQLSSSTMNFTGGELNISLEDYADAMWLTSDSKANFRGGVINADGGNFRLRGATLFDGTVLNADNAYIELSNDSTINSGEINMLDGYNSIEFNGMIEMNGGEINLAMADVYAYNGFFFNGGQINIDNTREPDKHWTALTVNGYFAMTGDAELNIDNALPEAAMRVYGCFHQMGGTVNLNHQYTEVENEYGVWTPEAVYIHADGGEVKGNILLNEGVFNINSMDDRTIKGIDMDENAVLFLGAQPREEGAEILPEQIPVLNLNNAHLVTKGILDMIVNAQLNVYQGIVDFQRTAEVYLKENARFTVQAARNPEEITPDTWNCAVYASAGSQISVMDESVLTVDADYYNCAVVIDGDYEQTGGTVTISCDDAVDCITGENCFSVKGTAVISGGTMNLSGTDTGFALDANTEPESGKRVVISGGDINIDVDRLGMWLASSAEITGGDFDIDVTGYVRDAYNQFGEFMGTQLYAQGIMLGGWDNPDANLTITGGNFNINIERTPEAYDYYQTNGIYVMEGSADITGGYFRLTNAEVNFNSGDPSDYMNVGLDAYSMDDGKLLQKLSYTMMFDSEGNDTSDPNAAVMTRYHETYETDNVPGNPNTMVGMDWATNLVLLSNKAGSNVTWKNDNGTLKFSGQGAMNSYAPGAAAPWVVLSDFIDTVEIDSNLEKIGSHAFSGLNKLATLDFLGNPPVFEENALYGVTADAYYIIGNDSWTADLLQNYGGTINWIQHFADETVTLVESDRSQLLPGQKATLTATITPGLDPDAKLVWELGEGDKNYVTLKANKDNTATITARKNKVLREVTVKAYVKDSESEPAVLTLKVLPLVTKVNILTDEGTDVTGKTHTFCMGDDNTLQLTAVNAPDGAYQSVTWKSSSTKIATVDENGLVTLLQPGKTVTITATAADGSGKKATVKIVTVQLMEDLTLKNPDADLFVAGTKSLKLATAVEIHPATTSNKKLQWSVECEDPNVKINKSTGVLTTKKVDQPVTATVTVVALDGSETTLSFDVTVYPATTKVTIWNEEQTRELTGKMEELYMTSDPDNADTMQLVAANIPAESVQAWTWKSSNAKFATVDENGLVTALVAGKTVTITATAADGTNKSASVKIKTVQPMEKVTLSGSPVAAANKTISLTADIYPSNTTNKKLVWTVDGSNVIISNGKLKVGRTIEDGTTVTVRAAWAENPEEVYGEWDVLLYSTAVDKVVVCKEEEQENPITGTLMVTMDTKSDNTVYLNAQTIAKDKVSEVAQNVVWKSSNAKYATVDEYGAVTILTPDKVVTITATAMDGSNKKATIKVKGVQPMEDLTLKNPDADLFVAGTKSLKLATAVEIHPATTSNKKLQWSVECEDPNVKINKSTGVLTTKKVDQLVTATVTAVALDGSETALSFDVTVYPATTKVNLWNGGKDVTGKTLTAPAGSMVALEAVCEPGNAAGVYTWKSSSTKYAEVDQDGVVTLSDAIGKTVTITATAADGTNKKATVKIKIIEAPEKDFSQLTSEERAKAEAEIRYAVSLLIDRNAVSGGQLPASSFVSVGMTDADGSQFYQNAGGNSYAGYWNTAASAYGANCAKAMAILTKYYDMDASGKLVGFPVLTYIYNEGAGHAAIAQSVQEDLAKYGIGLNLEMQEWNAFLDTRKFGDYSIARHGWLSDYNDPISMLDMWTSYSGNNDAQFGKGAHTETAAYNLDLTPWGYDIHVENGTWAETYDVLIGVIKSCGTSSVRYELMHLAEDMLMESGCIVPLYYYMDGYMLDDSVDGFGTNPLGLKFFQNTTVNGSGNSISVCLGPEPDTMDPALVTAVDTSSMIAHLFSGLAKLAPDASGNYTRIVADCAEELVEPVVNDDGTVTYTYTLKDGLTWSDGVAVTAHDFEFAWKRAASVELGAAYGYMFDQIKGYPDNLAVTATDDRTLSVTLNSDVPYWNEMLAFCAYMPVREDVVADEAWATDPSTYVSNGAYTMAQWSHDSLIVMEKNEDHWNADNVSMQEIRCLSNIDLQRYWADGALQFIDGEYEGFGDLYPSECYMTSALGTYFLLFNVNQPLLP